MRSMWKGAISFGLVMIPVKLYAATEQKDIAFRQVHRTDGGRIRFRRVCSACGQEVAFEDVAKGYELPSGEMVILTEEDMAGLPLPTTRSIEVLNFTPAEQLDPILYNRSYYVEPETSGVRAYALLRDALEESGKVAIAQVALRQREALATLRTRDGVLVLETLLWPDEVREAAFPFLDEDIGVRPQELRMAASLIESMTTDFDPSEYHDRYREALAELVAAKTEGRDVIQPQAAEAGAGEPASLVDALMASLAEAQQGRGSSENRGAAAGSKADGSKAPSSKAPSSKPAGARTASPKAASTKASDSGTDTSKPSTAQAGTAQAGTAKASTAKAGTAKAGTAKAGTAKAGTAKAGTAKAGTAKAGRSKAGSAETGDTTATSPPARRPRRRAS